MADAPYLVALALVEIQGRRALPLNGKSRSAGAIGEESPGEEGRALALELLVRLWQRSDEGPLRRLAGQSSLLLLEMPLEPLSLQVPPLKAAWLAGGDTDALLVQLRQLASRAWSVGVLPREPVCFTTWP